MKDEERRCPDCGHEVLSWDTVCPGCSRVPWDTPAGRRIVSRRRRRHFWITTGPFVALLVLVAGVVIVGNIHLSRALNNSRTAGELERLIERGLWLRATLEDTAPGTPVDTEVRMVVRQWLEEEWPALLAMVEDHRATPSVRSAAAMTVGKLFRASGRFAKAAEEQRAAAIEALSALLAEPNESIRTAAMLALHVMGERDAWE